MRKITKLTMKDVRCFKGEQSIDIRPITLLVGENSGGKSTVLGCYHALLYFFTTQLLDFNVEPFEMGSFADIMRKDKNANTEFMIGVDDDFDSEFINYQFTFGQNEGKSVLHKLTLTFLSGGSVTIAFSNKKIKGRVINLPIEKTPNNFLVECYNTEDSYYIARFIINSFSSFELYVDKKDKGGLSLRKFITDKNTLFIGKQGKPSFPRMHHFLSPAENFVGISPIRSKPQRTYHPFSGQAHSEGDEVPLFMRRLMLTNQDAWKYLHRELVKFGKSSGIFKDIRIRTFNDDMNDPFQIQIKHAEYYVNIMDVGYGVSQILPILVSMIMTKYYRKNRNSKLPKFFNPDLSTRLLLQEPGMHLHPQAQAAFGSLLVHFAENGKGQNFLVETHSDFIVDRICTEIRDGNISPENVSLIYHEMKKGYVQLHNITFDKMGNLENVPDGYRDFFMHEMNKVLGL
ncbi:MAG: AAA family ATPase [Gammaproteobacteria bacterium WSBS_2016_MAG_OTU1]